MKLTAPLFTGFPLKYYVQLKISTVFRYALILISVYQFSRVYEILCTCLKGTADSPHFRLSAK